MQRTLLITGKLAEPALRRIVGRLSEEMQTAIELHVLPISVVALATTKWIAGHIPSAEGFDRVVIPGLCQGDIGPIAQRLAKPVDRGPDDFRDLPDFLGSRTTKRDGYGDYDMEILAEINHAPTLSLAQLLSESRALAQSGADIIDLGCDPQGGWSQVGDAVSMLRDEGLRVSIDSFDAVEVEQATRAGAELVLSVNTSNCERASSWGCEVVAIPDSPTDLSSLDRIVDRLVANEVPFRIDPILEPIGLGFANSLERYLQIRRKFPDAEMMMGVGNVTELTDVDSAGVNVVLAGFCQELGIRSVLTTQVISWCQSCVRELDLARRLMHFACANRIPPKKVDSSLVVLRDAKLHELDDAALLEMRGRIKDKNYRVFADKKVLHLLNREHHLKDEDPFAIFEALQESESIDPAHAFYLGYELAKAKTAMTLGKNYVQDQALRFGFLTRMESSHPPELDSMHRRNET